jgi:phospholipase/carboxylesterase
MSLPSIAPSDYPLTLSKHLQFDVCGSTTADTGPDRLTPHCLFSPIHYETGYAYPLIVWLHGPCDNENQLRTVLPLVSMRNHIAIGPRGTTSETQGGSVTHWAKSNGSPEVAVGSTPAITTFCWTQAREEITLAMERVLDCIDIATSRYHVHRDRIFIAGYDCGGTMALRIALENPQFFAGAISLSGSLPRGLNLLRHINEARSLPLLIGSSSDSQKYSPMQACEDLRLLHSAGFSLDLRQYPCGDELTTKMLSDMDQWILNRICC